MRDVTDSVQSVEGVTGIRLDSDAPVFMTAVINAAIRELLTVALDAAMERKVVTVDNVDIAEAVKTNPVLAGMFAAWALSNAQYFEKRARAPRKPAAGKKKAASKKKGAKKASPRSRTTKKASGSPRSASDDGEGSPAGRRAADEDDDEDDDEDREA